MYQAGTTIYTNLNDQTWVSFTASFPLILSDGSAIAGRRWEVLLIGFIPEKRYQIEASDLKQFMFTYLALKFKDHLGFLSLFERTLRAGPLCVAIFADS